MSNQGPTIPNKFPTRVQPYLTWLQSYPTRVQPYPTWLQPYPTGVLPGCKFVPEQYENSKYSFMKSERRGTGKYCVTYKILIVRRKKKYSLQSFGLLTKYTKNISGGILSSFSTSIYGKIYSVHMQILTCIQKKNSCR